MSHTVLPETLIAQLIDNAATLGEHLHQDFASIGEKREQLRAQLLDEDMIFDVEAKYPPARQVFTIDGAHIAEVDRGSAYSISCAVRVGEKLEENDQASTLSILPHVACLTQLSAGLMMMHEIMLSVQVVEQFPNAICLIDGGRINSIIHINQFYSGIERDLPKQLGYWREQFEESPDREPGRTLAAFESRDWLTPYLLSPRIVGNLKLVTTTTLVENYMTHWVGRFDDKTFASLVLEASEALQPVSANIPDRPYHVSTAYPFYEEVNESAQWITIPGDKHQLHHLYYRPDAVHGVFKIEMNRTFLDNEPEVGSLLSWWLHDTMSPDLQEPYRFYVADRFAKSAVSVAKNALKEVARRDMELASWAWFFSQPYRTE